ncbi:MAG: hypothetical protein K6E50_06425 [Lachnospiraceae bacterium]|nr:hypothetical protein [Lachnospiraceae bacterium]
METKVQKKKAMLTAVSIYHYVRLIARSLTFLVLLYYYVMYRVQGGQDISEMIESHPVVLSVICIVFLVEMTLRFFPSRLESPGCQKQFAKNYVKTGKTDIVIQDDNAVMLVALIWIAFNAVFGMLHMKGILDDGIMLLLCSFYSVCDLICILFFCPFQSWLLKNKCCCTCRIYNWDYAMMFTPLFFVQKTYTWGLLVLSVALLARWEITFYRFPERFSENTNAYLNCANCTEKLCSHKKQLKTLWIQISRYMQERIKKLKK